MSGPELERHFHESVVQDCEDAIIGAVDGAVVTWNRGAETMFGYSRQEAIGRQLSTFIPPERARELPDLIARLERGERIKHFETERVRKDGTRIPVSLTLSPVRDGEGRFTGVSAIARDISERQRTDRALRASEEELRRIHEREQLALKASNLGVWESNLVTDVVYWSQTCEALHGLAPGTFGGHFASFIERVHADDRGDVLRTLHEAQERRTPTEIQYRTVSTPERWIRSMVQVLYDEDGTPIRSAGVAIDVTERRLLEDQLRQAQKMEGVRQLAGGVAHDFNNMLTAILGNADFVLDQLPTGDPRRIHLDEITTAARRAAALTQQLLAFSRKQILSPTVVHLGDIVNGIIPMLRRLLGETIELQAITWDRGRVKADAMQIEQVLLNLAVNARDAMPEGGRLTIETTDVHLDDDSAREHPHVTTGPHVMIAVSDTGVGMDAATHKRLFEPFFTTKPKGKGTGLGLATVYGIAKQSGGYIHVSSEVGRGTTFKLYLPCTDDADAAPPVEPHGEGVLNGEETILLVEDEELVRSFAHRVLESYGYAVTAVADPRHAIDVASPGLGRIDIIVSDVVLPEINGRTMATIIRERHPESKVLYMSGYADDAIVHHGVLERGMRFLAKPFSAEALARAVRDTIEDRPVDQIYGLWRRWGRRPSSLSGSRARADGRPGWR